MASGTNGSGFEESVLFRKLEDLVSKLESLGF